MCSPRNVVSPFAENYVVQKINSAKTDKKASKSFHHMLILVCLSRELLFLRVKWSEIFSFFLRWTIIPSFLIFKMFKENN